MCNSPRPPAYDQFDQRASSTSASSSSGGQRVGQGEATGRAAARPAKTGRLLAANGFPVSSSSLYFPDWEDVCASATATPSARPASPAPQDDSSSSREGNGIDDVLPLLLATAQSFKGSQLATRALSLVAGWYSSAAPCVPLPTPSPLPLWPTLAHACTGPNPALVKAGCQVVASLCRAGQASGAALAQHGIAYTVACLALCWADGEGDGEEGAGGARLQAPGEGLGQHVQHAWEGICSVLYPTRDWRACLLAAAQGESDTCAALLPPHHSRMREGAAGLHAAVQAGDGHATEQHVQSLLSYLESHVVEVLTPFQLCLSGLARALAAAAAAACTPASWGQGGKGAVLLQALSTVLADQLHVPEVDLWRRADLSALLPAHTLAWPWALPPPVPRGPGGIRAARAALLWDYVSRTLPSLMGPPDGWDSLTSAMRPGSSSSSGRVGAGRGMQTGEGEGSDGLQVVNTAVQGLSEALETGRCIRPSDMQQLISPSGGLHPAAHPLLHTTLQQVGRERERALPALLQLVQAVQQQTAVLVHGSEKNSKRGAQSPYSHPPPVSTAGTSFLLPPLRHGYARLVGMGNAPAAMAPGTAVTLLSRKPLPVDLVPCPSDPVCALLCLTPSPSSALTPAATAALAREAGLQLYAGGVAGGGSTPAHLSTPTAACLSPLSSLGDLASSLLPRVQRDLTALRQGVVQAAAREMEREREAGRKDTPGHAPPASTTTPVCRFYKRGGPSACQRGLACRFAHTGWEGGAQATAAAAAAPAEEGTGAGKGRKHGDRVGGKAVQTAPAPAPAPAPAANPSSASSSAAAAAPSHEGPRVSSSARRRERRKRAKARHDRGDPSSPTHEHEHEDEGEGEAPSSAAHSASLGMSDGAGSGGRGAVSASSSTPAAPHSTPAAPHSTAQAAPPIGSLRFDLAPSSAPHGQLPSEVSALASMLAAQLSMGGTSGGSGEGRGEPGAVRAGFTRHRPPMPGRHAAAAGGGLGMASSMESPPASSPGGGYGAAPSPSPTAASPPAGGREGQGGGGGRYESRVVTARDIGRHGPLEDGDEGHGIGMEALEELAAGSTPSSGLHVGLWVPSPQDPLIGHTEGTCGGGEVHVIPTLRTGDAAEPAGSGPLPVPVHSPVPTPARPHHASLLWCPPPKAGLAGVLHVRRAAGASMLHAGRDSSMAALKSLGMKDRHASAPASSTAPAMTAAAPPAVGGGGGRGAGGREAGRDSSSSSSNREAHIQRLMRALAASGDFAGVEALGGDQEDEQGESPSASHHAASLARLLMMGGEGERGEREGRELEAPALGAGQAFLGAGSSSSSSSSSAATIPLWPGECPLPVPLASPPPLRAGLHGAGPRAGLTTPGDLVSPPRTPALQETAGTPGRGGGGDGGTAVAVKSSSTPVKRALPATLPTASAAGPSSPSSPLLSALHELHTLSSSLAVRALWFAHIPPLPPGSSSSYPPHAPLAVSALYGPGLWDVPWVERVAGAAGAGLGGQGDVYQAGGRLVWGTLGPGAEQGPPTAPFCLPPAGKEGEGGHGEVWVQVHACTPLRLALHSTGGGQQLELLSLDDAAVRYSTLTPLPRPLQPAAGEGESEWLLALRLLVAAEGSGGGGGGGRLAPWSSSKGRISTLLTQAVGRLLRDPMACLAHAIAWSTGQESSLPALVRAVLLAPTLLPIALRLAYMQGTGMGTLQAVWRADARAGEAEKADTGGAQGPSSSLGMLFAPPAPCSVKGRYGAGSVSEAPTPDPWTNQHGWPRTGGEMALVPGKRKAITPRHKVLDSLKSILGPHYLPLLSSGPTQPSSALARISAWLQGEYGPGEDKEAAGVLGESRLCMGVGDRVQQRGGEGGGSRAPLANLLSQAHARQLALPQPPPYHASPALAEAVPGGAQLGGACPHQHAGLPSAMRQEELACQFAASSSKDGGPGAGAGEGTPTASPSHQQSGPATEEGHGLGPTLEAYTLACREAQRRYVSGTVVVHKERHACGLRVWHETEGAGEGEEGEGSGEEDTTDAEEHFKNPFVQGSQGLHPAPVLLFAHPCAGTGGEWRVSSPSHGTGACATLMRHWECLGRLVGKAFLDGRPLDLPLSEPFLRVVQGLGRLSTLPDRPPSSYHGPAGPVQLWQPQEVTDAGVRMMMPVKDIAASAALLSPPALAAQVSPHLPLLLPEMREQQEGRARVLPVFVASDPPDGPIPRLDPAVVLPSLASVDPALASALAHLLALVAARDSAQAALAEHEQAARACLQYLSTCVDGLCLDYSLPGYPSTPCPLLPARRSMERLGAPASLTAQLQPGLGVRQEDVEVWAQATGAQPQLRSGRQTDACWTPALAWHALPVLLPDLHLYVTGVLWAYACQGCALQAAAFAKGLAFYMPAGPLTLCLFTAQEVGELLCGAGTLRDDSLWAAEAVQAAIRPGPGYTPGSPHMRWLAEAIAALQGAEERKLFLRFVSGAARLPPGGFPALSPPLTVTAVSERDISSKARAQGLDSILPSCNTCQRTLKLPRYSSGQMLLSRLRLAILMGQGVFTLD